MTVNNADEPEPVFYNISLQSQQDTAASSNLGTITSEGASYVLPKTITKEVGLYSVEYTAATVYMFDHWETTGAITVMDTNAVSTTIMVSGDCTIKAIYAIQVPLKTNAYLVVRGAGNEIYYHIDSAISSWLGWTLLPGSTIDSPAATVCDNKLYIAVLGSDGYSLYFGSVNLADNGFSGWNQIEGAGLSTPTLTSNGTHVFMVVRGFDNMIYYRAYQCSSRIWSTWHVISGLT